MHEDSKTLVGVYHVDRCRVLSRPTDADVPRPHLCPGLGIVASSWKKSRSHFLDLITLVTMVYQTSIEVGEPVADPAVYIVSSTT